MLLLLLYYITYAIIAYFIVIQSTFDIVNTICSSILQKMFTTVYQDVHYIESRLYWVASLSIQYSFFFPYVFYVERFSDRSPDGKRLLDAFDTPTLVLLALVRKGQERIRQQWLKAIPEVSSEVS